MALRHQPRLYEGYHRLLRDHYDWRKSEARLNAFANFRANVDGQTFHFILERASDADAPALILTHGWPGSVVEFVEVIEKLAHPERFGGDARDAFTVVVPSLPGYAFSTPLKNPLAPRDVARLWHALMTRHLGFQTFFAQGGDWGAMVTSWLAYDFPDAVKAMHLNQVGFDATGDKTTPHDAEETAWIEANLKRRALETGYIMVQAPSRCRSPMG